MPDAAVERDRNAAAWRNLVDALRACTVSGVVEPAAVPGAWRFVPVGSGGVRGRVEGLVVVAGREDAAIFVPVEIEDGVAVFLGPEPSPAPHLVFVR